MRCATIKQKDALYSIFSYHSCLTCDHLAPQPLVQLTPKLAWVFFILWASDAALPFFQILGGRGSILQPKGTPLLQFRDPLWLYEPRYISKKGRAASLENITRTYHTNFGTNWTNGWGARWYQVRTPKNPAFLPIPTPMHTRSIKFKLGYILWLRPFPTAPKSLPFHPQTSHNNWYNFAQKIL